MRPTPIACGDKVTYCRLNYRTAQCSIKTKNRTIFVGFDPRDVSFRTHFQSMLLTHERGLSAVDPEYGAEVGLSCR
jgi:hypothetical protein